MPDLPDVRSDSSQRQEERVTINKEFESLDAFVSEYIANVSRSGAFVRTRDPLPVGTHINLCFTVLMDGVHTVVIGTAEWGGVAALPKLRVPEGEENAICTFHLYEPHLFTHQGASWMSAVYQTEGVVWPGPPERPVTPVPAAQEEPWAAAWFQGYNTEPYERNPAGPKPILDDLDWAARNGERLGCPLWLGEFGSYSQADMDSRVQWTTFVRKEAEARGTLLRLGVQAGSTRAPVRLTLARGQGASVWRYSSTLV